MSVYFPQKTISDKSVINIFITPLVALSVLFTEITSNCSSVSNGVCVERLSVRARVSVRDFMCVRVFKDCLSVCVCLRACVCACVCVADVGQLSTFPDHTTPKNTTQYMCT